MRTQCFAKLYEVKYAMIVKLKAQHSIPHLCQMLNVARSGYQSWLSGKTNSLALPMRVAVALTAHSRFRQSYVTPRGLKLASIVSSAYVKPQAFAASTSASSESPPTPNTYCPLHLICLTVNLIKLARQIRCGSQILPTSPLMKAGSIWQ